MSEKRSMVEQRCTLLSLTIDWSEDSQEITSRRMRSYPNREDHPGLERVAAEMVALIEASGTEEEAVEKIKLLPPLT